MKLKTLSFALIITFLAIGFSSTAKEKQLLRLNLTKGTTYEMTMDMTNKIDQEIMGNQVKMDQTMVMVISLTVEDQFPSGNFLIRYGYDKMKISINAMGQTMNFDTSNPDENSPMFAPMKSLTDIKLKMEITPRGDVVSIEGLDQYTKAFANNPQLSSTLSMFSSEEAFKSNFSQTFNYFPEEEIGKGDSWDATFKMPAMMNMEMAMNFQATGVSKDYVDLAVKSTINSDSPIEANGIKMDISIEGTQDGTMQINAEDGMVNTSEITQLFSMLMKMKNPQTNEDMEIPMKMNSTVKISTEKK